MQPDEKKPTNSTETQAPFAPISTTNAVEYSWGDRCKAWFLLKNPKLTVIEEEMPPGTSELLHFHHQAQQLFYTLDGEAIIDIGAESVDLKPAQSIHVAPGVPHRIRNAGAGILRFLVISEPESHGDKELVIVPAS